MHRILVLHGPNLNALGTREPETYGHDSLDDIDRRLQKLGTELGCRVECTQSQHEGVLIDALYGAAQRADGVLLNPGGLTHTSVALRDAMRATPVPVVEVHVSNPHAREPFRQISMTAGAALGVVAGFGSESYLVGLRALAGHLSRARTS
jgi:3-dehydroquinate dehydratase-2